MTQALAIENDEMTSRAWSVENLEAPSITVLGSLDDDQETNGLGLDPSRPKPLLAIIYSGV